MTNTVLNWIDRIQQDMPLLRVGQVIENAVDCYNQTNNSKIPLFYLDDELLERALMEYYYKAKENYITTD